MPGPRRKTLEEFFWARVKKGKGCWLWRGRYDGVGYGTIQLYKGAKRIGAHRASWMIENKQVIPAGMHICHHCDVRPCVRPDHLFLGTPADNLRDAQRKGRLSVPGKGWMRDKTHCPQGHPYNKENTYRWKSKRICRLCHAAHAAKSRLKKKRAA